MNTTTLTAVLLAALLVTSGIAFAAPGGAATGSADANANGSVHADADETDRDRDGRTAEDGPVESDDGTADADDGERDDERDGGVSRPGVVVSAVVGSGAGSDGDVRVDGEVGAGGDGSSDDGTDARERAADRVRSIHDRVRAFVSGTLDGDLGVRVGLDVFAGTR